MVLRGNIRIFLKCSLSCQPNIVQVQGRFILLNPDSSLLRVYLGIFHSHYDREVGDDV